MKCYSLQGLAMSSSHMWPCLHKASHKCHTSEASTVEKGKIELAWPRMDITRRMNLHSLQA